MKINKLKVYGAFAMLLAGLSTVAPESKMTVNAEEEEVLYVEETETSVEYEDAEPSAVTEEEKAQEESSIQAAEEEASREAESAKAEASSIAEEQKEQETFVEQNTEIDKEDEKYNTGRTEIPDYVKTEAERKGIKPLEDKPKDKPQDKPQETQPSTPQQTQPSTPQETQPVPTTNIDLPKTGPEFNYMVGGGLGLGLSAIAIEIIQEIRETYGKKVVSSKPKFRKQKQKRKKR